MALEILYVEDDPLDVRLMQEAMSACSIPHELTVASSAASGLAQLCAGARAIPPRSPNVVVCDLHMPDMSGHEFLRAVKSDTALRWVPVIILTATDSEAEIAMCYELHASCVVRKPSTFNELCEVARCISEFWLTIAVPPRHEVHR